ncbi:MAG TPA: cellulase family glycosylhydrolase [Candidatus Sulfotelmatobacter sp.]|nr:cellulase family glycosylhydrolase [Candidatus Sulfotelmatobacter sp.]
MRKDITSVAVLAALLLSSALGAAPLAIQISTNGPFVLASSGKPFVPRGFNYDRDFKFRLIEDYWQAEWGTIEQDFREMKALGATVVRVHLQFAKFMDGPDQPNRATLERLGKLVELAEQVGLYLDLTGLGCYRKAEVPAWYDGMAEPEHWAAQARFWEAVARTCAGRPGVFCYDLVNEPVVSAERRKPGEWVHPFGLEGFHYVQFINLDPAGRERAEIARQWTRRMVQAIRKHDRQHLVTVGLGIFEVSQPEGSGFEFARIAPEVDFLSIHIYPEEGKFEAATRVLKRCQVGKPVVIEEVFPLRCSTPSLERFLKGSEGLVQGWIGFYWGQTPAELKGSTNMNEQLTLSWLELFQKLGKSEGRDPKSERSPKAEVRTPKAANTAP